MTTIFLLTFLCLSLFFNNLISPNNQIKNMDSNNEIQKIAIKKGETFSIILDDYSAAGYNWTFSINNNLIIPIGKPAYIKEEPVGSAGQTKFNFKGVGEGESIITLINKRSWEDVAFQKIYYLVNISHY